jgi:serine kinase of HPr protein (carbohydrate metabolism regulator)
MTGGQKPLSLHAAAAVVGEAGVLIRGVSGAGKTSLALALVEAAALRGLFARLVADDRVLVEHCNGRLIARPHPAIAGRVERRGQGVGRIGHEGAAVLRFVVDFAPALGAPGAPERLPQPGSDVAGIDGVDLPRLVIPAGLGAAETARILLDALSRRLD